ncbi:MAG: flagellar type III secretion system pore protein FliP [Clostridia bacterium]|nr:flagellar type III secretion system pore protein FliP [Clostridia bacterium]
MNTSRRYRFLIIIFAVLILCSLNYVTARAEPLPIPKIGVNVEPAETPEDVGVSLQIIFLLTILTLAPSILMMMTSFTRIIIVLGFIRNALGTQQMPPNQVLIGLALFLTFFIMSPIYSEINENAIQPYMNQDITQEQAIENAQKPIREFMVKQTRKKDLQLFVELSNNDEIESIDALPMSTLIPAFMISELKTAFQIGFLIFIPFIIIDMVVASTLMSMGMMMLPPVLISLPFKILLFVMVDGWHLISRTIVTGFR